MGERVGLTEVTLDAWHEAAGVRGRRWSGEVVRQLIDEVRRLRALVAQREAPTAPLDETRGEGV